MFSDHRPIFLEKFRFFVAFHASFTINDRLILLSLKIFWGNFDRLNTFAV